VNLTACLALSIFYTLGSQECCKECHLQAYWAVSPSCQPKTTRWTEVCDPFNNTGKKVVTWKRQRQRSNSLPSALVSAQILIFFLHRSGIS
jgi:hypothetical protein